MSKSLSKNKAIDDCMYNLLWEIPGSNDWKPEMHEYIRKELEKVYYGGLYYGVEHYNIYKNDND